MAGRAGLGKAFNQMGDSVQNLYERVYALQLANKEAQIEFLKIQINPHFLYNSLDTISWMGYDAGHEQISEIAASLAGILRASISSPDMITVSEEVLTLKRYLYIQQIRFEDKVTITLYVEPETEECRMPSFLEFTVSDNGTGMSKERLQEILHRMETEKAGESIGLPNVYRRLKLIYGDQLYFHIESSQETGTNITFRIPVAENEQNEETRSKT